MIADIHNYKMRVESGLRSLDREKFADEDKLLLLKFRIPTPLGQTTTPRCMMTRRHQS